MQRRDATTLARWDHAKWLRNRLGEARQRIADLENALTLIAGITESPSDEIVRVQLHNAQRLAKEALDA